MTLQAAINLDELLQEAEELPTSPAVARKVIQVVRREDVVHSDLESLAILDPALAIRLLRLANSSLFGAAGRVASLGHAVARIEMHAARLTLLGFDLLEQDRMPPICWEVWKRCRATAIISRKLARLFPEVHPDEAEVIGLVANVGNLLHAATMPVDCAFDSRQSEAERFEQLTDGASFRFGMSHSDLASRLFARWNLPDLIVKAVEAYLDMDRVERLPGRDREMARVLFLAAGIVGAAISGKSTDMQVFIAQLQLWARLGNDAVDSIMETVAVEMAEVDGLFAPQPYESERIVGEARRELMELSIVAASDLARTARKARETQKQIDKLRKQRDLLERQVTTDPLTGIGNRKFFDQRIDEELERCRRHGTAMALIMFDLDRFKSLNDHYGHVAGDEVLRQIAAAIRKCLRSSDIFTRYGGEEFAIIAPETDLEGAMASAQRMRKCLEDLAIPVDGNVLHITASFGVACVEDARRYADSESILKVADRFLYQAKREGRNRVCGGIA